MRRATEPNTRAAKMIIASASKKGIIGLVSTACPLHKCTYLGIQCSRLRGMVNANRPDSSGFRTQFATETPCNKPCKSDNTNEYSFLYKWLTYNNKFYNSKTASNKSSDWRNTYQNSSHQQTCQ